MLIALFTAWTSIPFILLLMQSVKPRLLMFTDPPTIIFKPTMEHFRNVFQKQDLFIYMKNSLLIALSCTVLCLLMGSLLSYALVTLHVPGGRWIGLLALITRMIPAGALMVPIYVIMRKINLSGTYSAVILTHTALNLSFAVWMLRSFFSELPFEIEEAALIDGCSRISCFFRIALPLTLPGLVATGILTMLNSWNEFMFSLVLSSLQTRTLPIAISSFIGSISVDWGSSSAAAVAASLPVFLAGFFTQKHLTKGLTVGSVKG